MALDKGIVVVFGDERRTLGEVIAAAIESDKTHIVVDHASLAHIPARAVALSEGEYAQILKAHVSIQDMRRVIDVTTGEQEDLYLLRHPKRKELQLQLAR